MIFHFKTAQNLIAEHYERDFDSIFQFKTAQKRGSDHYETDFYMNCGSRKIPPTKIPPTKIPPTKIPPTKIPPNNRLKGGVYLT